MCQMKGPARYSVLPDYEPYLHDESLYTGSADTISFPTTREEICAAVLECQDSGQRITVQGARTGIVGGAIPDGGHVLNLSKYNRILDVRTGETPEIDVEAGATGEEIIQAVRRASQNTLFLPALPTEKSATVGGMLSANAAGLSSYRYGPLWEHVTALTVCDAKGQLHTLQPGTPEWRDWVASEGQLGVITNATLKLTPLPAHTWGLLFFFEGDEGACSFMDQVESLPAVDVLEYLDGNSARCVEVYRKDMSAIASLPAFPEGMEAMVYVEISGQSEEDMEETACALIEACMNAGGDPDAPWAMSTEAEVESLRAYRHAISECINMTVAISHAQHPEITKISADLRWPESLSRLQILQTYRRDLEQTSLSFCIFGHLGARQPYVNIMAKTPEEYRQGRDLMLGWTRQAVAAGGCAFPEHGVGRLKLTDFAAVADFQLLQEFEDKKRRWDADCLFTSGSYQSKMV